jgi:hypothetical protein
MSSRYRTGVTIGVFGFFLALGARIVPMYWSPLPATLDGFRYARLAAWILETSSFPWHLIQADELVFTSALAVASSVSGVRPLYLAQPFVSVVGAVAPLIGVVIIRRLGRRWAWSARRVTTASLLVAFSLAIEGLLLRRTGVPDEEAVGILLVPLVVFAAHRWIASARPAWAVLAGGFFAMLPPLHNLSTLIGVLSLHGLVVFHLFSPRRTVSTGSVLAAGAFGWGYFVGFFEAAVLFGIELSYSGLLRPHLDLFIGWVLVYTLAVLWFARTSLTIRRLTFLAPLGLWFGLVGANLIRPVFPGTLSSPRIVVLLTLPLLLPIAFAGIGLSTITRGTGAVVLSLLGGPLVFAYYVLTASLTPPFFGAAIRAQSFAHLPVLVLSACGVVLLQAKLSASDSTSGGRARRGLSAALAVLLILALVTTLPLGYMNLDTGTYPSTTFDSELAAASFATTHVEGEYTTDHTLSRVVGHYAAPHSPEPGGNASTVQVAPTRRWLRSGEVPMCPILSQQSWRTSGAHLYPSGPRTLSTSAYRTVLQRRGIVYTTTGYDPVYLSAGARPSQC